MLLENGEADADEDEFDKNLADKMRLTTLRVINNFGLDFKQFVK